MDEKRIAANFGENLKYYLAKYGVNQAELAKRLDVTPAAVSSWITGQKTPRMDKVTVLTRMFHCTVADLLDPHTSAERAADFEQSLINEYTLDPKIRELVLYAGGIEPGEARDKYVGAVLLALRAMCEAGKK